jgi:purine-binding chemotaxis protein CheW
MPEATSQQLVVFSLGSEEYALPIGTVHEIIRYTELSDGAIAREASV